MDKFHDGTQVRQFLKGKGIEVEPTVVAAIVKELQSRECGEEGGLYGLYTGPSAICGKGTVYKVKDLYEKGGLDPILDFMLGPNRAEKPGSANTLGGNSRLSESGACQHGNCSSQLNDCQIVHGLEVAEAQNISSYGRERDDASEGPGMDPDAHGIFSRFQDLHLQELMNLVSQLGRSLTVLGLTDRINEPAMSMEEFFQRCKDTPGGQWYWGPPAPAPVLKVETLPGFSLLREHGRDWGFWTELEGFRQALGSYIQGRQDLLRRISSEAQNQTRRPVSPHREILHGSITPQYYETIYQWAWRLALNSQVQDFPKHISYPDIGVSPPVHRISFNPIPTNHPLTFGNAVIAWAPTSTELMRPDASIHKRLMKARPGLSTFTMGSASKPRDSVTS